MMASVSTNEVSDAEIQSMAQWLDQWVNQLN